MEDMNCQFVAFKYDPDTCATCGKRASWHEPKMMPHADAIWKMLIKYGGIHDFYGGFDTEDTVAMKLHFGYDVDFEQFGLFTTKSWYEKTYGKMVKGECAVDLDKSREPRMDTVTEFAGTFTEHHDERAAIVGHLACKCGQYGKNKWNLVEVAILDKTLGELIWLAVKEGEIE